MKGVEAEAACDAAAAAMKGVEADAACDAAAAAMNKLKWMQQCWTQLCLDVEIQRSWRQQ